MAFIDQLPTKADNPTFFQYGLTHGPGYGEMYAWMETVEVDGIPFLASFTAHSDMWNGYGDKMNPKNHLGPRFSIQCREDNFETGRELKGKRLRRICRVAGQRHFKFYNLGTPSNPCPTTLVEARQVFEDVLRRFLSGQLAIDLGERKR